MGRHMRRRPLKPRPPRWTPVRDGVGAWIIVNEQGEQPLRAEDPLERLSNLYLVAAAPALFLALQIVTRRMQWLIPEASGWQHRDRKLVMEAVAALADARPPIEELLRVERLGGQREIDFDVA